MDSSAPTAHVDSKIVKENWVVADSEVVAENYQNCFQSWLMDSSSHIAPIESEILKENWVTTYLETVTKTASTGDWWIRQCTQPMLTLK